MRGESVIQKQKYYRYGIIKGTLLIICTLGALIL